MKTGKKGERLAFIPFHELLLDSLLYFPAAIQLAVQRDGTEDGAEWIEKMTKRKRQNFSNTYARSTSTTDII